MPDNEFAEKISLLPEGLAEKNDESWEDVVSRYESFVNNNEPFNDGFLPVLDLVKRISVSEQAKLFRAGTSLYSLLISTAEKHGLEEDDPFVAVDVQRNRNPKIEYWQNHNKVIESQLCESADILFSTLQSFLDRLWNETRGKRDA
jgi:hypothetical protein